MEIVKQETVKEVHSDDYTYNSRNINSKANAGLALGITGTALAGLALFSGKGKNWLGGGANEPNININSIGGASTFAGPTAFEAWQKECEDTVALQKGLYEWALASQNQRFNDRQTLDSELFGLYKSQIDADFGLYKNQRDSFDVLNAKVASLESRVAVNEAIRPYQDKLLQCEIDKAFTASINYSDRLNCRNIKGELVLPSTPTITGYGSYNPCSCPSTTQAAG